jgi:hypothetical protein
METRSLALRLARAKPNLGQSSSLSAALRPISNRFSPEARIATPPVSVEAVTRSLSHPVLPCGEFDLENPV